MHAYRYRPTGQSLTVHSAATAAAHPILSTSTPTVYFVKAWWGLVPDVPFPVERKEESHPYGRDSPTRKLLGIECPQVVPNHGTYLGDPALISKSM